MTHVYGENRLIQNYCKIFTQYVQQLGSLPQLVYQQNNCKL